MKKIRNVVLILALLLSFNGCEKNLVNEEFEQHNDQFTIEQAQAWFGDEWTGTLNLKSGSSEKTKIGIKPDWCDGFTSQNDQVEVVEVGLLVQGSFGIATEASFKNWETTKNQKMIRSLTRMVFLKYKKDGRIDQFLMTIVGDKEYHEKRVGRLAENSYLSREKHFSGYIYYHDITGNFVNGWKYEKGKLVGKTTQISGDGLPTTLKMATTCITTNVYTTYMQCTDWYRDYDGDGARDTYTNTTCGSSFISFTPFTECPVYFTGEGGFGTTYLSTVGTPGGGSPGGYDPSSSPPAPEPVPCTCLNECSICGKCKDNLVQKSANTNCIPREVCTCPVPAQVVNAIALQNNPKANCIYLKLINGGILSSFISRYFGLTAPNQSYLGELNLTWTLGRSTATLPIGVPKMGVYNSVEIRLNETVLNSNSATDGALSMLHEALHAKLIAEYYDSAGTTDFKRLYAYYEGWGNITLDKNQETEILNTYSNDMASALKTFDQSQGIDHSLEFYVEAVKYHLSNEIFGVNYYPAGYNAFITIFNSTNTCN